MPAAAVIPAPIAYVRVVAVKKLVVEYRTSLYLFLTLVQILFILLVSVYFKLDSKLHLIVRSPF